jgi:hypothetical protein
MPAFPRGRPAPGYPRIGGSGDPAGEGLEPVTPTKSWYAQWTSRALDVSPGDGGRLARLLLEHLAREGVLTSITSTSGAAVYAIPASGVVVSPTSAADLRASKNLLLCGTCRTPVTGSPTTVEQLAGAPCMLVTCPGRLAPSPLHDNFYQNLYSSPDMRRVVAREHTSLLTDEVRLAYENGFKGADSSPAAPNVLVATPTLEMGIDIGDLSAVVLASLPRTVASYLQRVGRAGRLTGNALNLAFITGRGEQLPKLGDPLSVINGEVRPPATYLRAEEILRRQYTAHLVDEFARDTTRPHPRSARGAIGASGPGTFLGDLIGHAETHTQTHLGRFVAAFDALPDAVVGSLRTWLAAFGGPGTSEFAAGIHEASGRWQTTVQALAHRRKAIDDALPALISQAESPAATDDDRRARRSAETARKLTMGQLAHLQGEYWIGVLEEYGLLPNYTLLDDNVTLDVGLSWMNPDTKTFQTEHARIRRGSAQAIREFAPGARFEDVPSSVELRWRPGDHQAAVTGSVWRAAPTGWVTRSSVSRSDRRCMCPLTRRNCLPASTIPAAHQRSAIVPSRQFLTLLACVRQIEIMLSTALVERKVRASVGGMPSRSTVRVSAMPSRRLAAAPG